MRTETTEILSLIRDIVSTFIHCPKELTIEVEESGSEAAFVLQGAAEDQRKLIGVKGANIYALTNVVAYFMSPNGYQYHIKELREPKAGLKSRFMPKVKCTSYDPKAAADLLRRIVAKLISAPFNIDTDKVFSDEMYVTFKIATPTDGLVALQQLQDDEGAMHHLSVLWTAYGNKEGVVFSIHYDSP